MTSEATADDVITLNNTLRPEHFGVVGISLIIFMQYQIDQSGKIEDTSKNTVLALANSKSFSVLITAKCKRQ